MNIESFENPKEFWRAVLGQVELEISPMVYKSVVARTQVESLNNNSVTILCEDDFVKKNLEKKHMDLVTKAIKNIAGKNLSIKVKVSTDKNGRAEKEEKDEMGPLFSSQKDPSVVIEEKRHKSNLSSKFTFENYIIGKNNNLAYAIATAVAEKPGELYNPVFIYSRVGLGKTHLIQAIGNRVIESKPGTRVIYTTGEAFTNELIEAIQSGKGKGQYTTNQFREKFRKADVLLIDDVQFIIGREATQEEFFHTFNTLYMAGKQIVITSDRPPKDFTNLEDRITSRFSSGIIADIQNPDMEMRAAILRAKRDENKDFVPNEVINYIAERVDSNIRELEGAYLQVVTYAKANGLELNVELASRALGQTIREKVAKNVNVNEILKAVCLYYSVKAQDLKGKRRNRELVIPRQVAMYLMKEITDMPFMTIGEFLGGRDHTTVMYGVDKIQAEMAQTGKTTQDVVNVKQIIFNN
ncbi:MAG: chromosomal replication initiator protein DnaA [Patescibacteria group bacterium]